MGENEEQIESEFAVCKKKETAIRTVLVDGKDAKRIEKANNNKNVLANQLAQIQISMQAQTQAISIILDDYIEKGEEPTNFDIATSILTVRKTDK